MSNNAVKTYKCIFNDIDLIIAFSEPEVTLNMLKEKSYSNNDLQKIIKGLKFLSKLCLEKGVIQDCHISKSLQELDIQTIKEKEEEEEDEQPREQRQNTEQCIDVTAHSVSVSEDEYTYDSESEHNMNKYRNKYNKNTNKNKNKNKNENENENENKNKDDEILNCQIDKDAEEIFFLRSLVKEMIPHLPKDMKTRLALLFFDRLEKN